ncbi:hypothetical protein [Gandjariella thermophila]|uniref:Thiol-disulfide oxidoreductase n=1 Tax=Gandjariella thermophila TaxID=1931992 RepID=A0A4D4JDK8_9PSEU|nr:hypothetical protein [Gandjariella thermophila]GDY31987.1 hypothetical protein GTS_36200 [Gandjariella thermophila]
MSETQTRWVLAFDASCRACWWLSRLVSRTSGGKLEVRPLADQDVREWRDRALGAGAVQRPTLIMVDGPDVVAWTGASMAVKVMRHLGPWSTIRALDALSQSRHAGGRPSPARMGNAGARLL